MPTSKPYKDSGHGFWARVGITRSIIVALLLSILAHGLFVVGMSIASYLELPFAVQFEASQGIGVMSRIGQRLASDARDTAPRYTNVVDLTPPPASFGPDKPTDEQLQAMAHAREELEEQERQAEQQRAEQRRRERRAAQKNAQRQAEKDAERAARDADTPSADNDQERTEDHAPDSSAHAASGVDTGDEATKSSDGSNSDASSKPQGGPRLDLPPGKRYPQGTINPVATDLSMWGPEGARLVVVVRNDRLRNSPHAKSVGDVLDSFPDWRTLVGGADIDPLQEVDTTVIASADPRYINQTFLAAMHHMPAEQVVGLISQGEHGGVTWKEENGRLIGDFEPRSGRDPRKFFIPTDGVFVFSRPNFMDDLSAQAPTPRGLEAAIELAQLSKAEQQARLANAAWKQKAPSARRATRKPPKRDDGWLRGLIEVADYGGTGSRGAAAMVSTGKISNMRIKGYRGTMPQSMHANIYTSADVRITGRMIFAKQREAEALQDAWPDVMSANRTSLNFVGLYRPLSDAKLSIDHNELIFEFSIPQATMRRLSVSVSQLMEMRN